jgi:HD-GYP domain-containing protein (c-di-GMP phosphodiesterase class II)
VEGARILSARGQGNALAATVAYEHHIWENGEKGYPLMSFTRRCHYASRLVHVCDVYDALSTRRPYRDAWPREKALGLLAEQAGTEMDPHMVRAFLSLSEKANETRTPLVGPVADGAWTSDLARTAAEMTEAVGKAPVETPGL